MNFNIIQLNSPFDDSAFFVRNMYKKRSFLLDCGRLGRLAHSDVLTLDDIFVSHTHMDHFFGFDRILRGSIISNRELRVYGPTGFINNVDGKFRGYTWNLAEDYGFSIRAFELNPDGTCNVGYFSAKNRFVPEISKYTGGYPFNIDDDFTMSAEYFDHRTLSVGYRIAEPLQFKVLPEKFEKYGYLAGKWISQLIRALVNDKVDTVLDVAVVGGVVQKTAKELAEQITEKKQPQSITYITDCAPIADNIEKAINFAKDTDLLIIESVFSDEDYEHALAKNHLTVGLAKKILLESNAKRVRFAHFASRYEMDKAAFLNELYDGIEDKIFFEVKDS